LICAMFPLLVVVTKVITLIIWFWILSEFSFILLFLNNLDHISRPHWWWVYKVKGPCWILRSCNWIHTSRWVSCTPFQFHFYTPLFLEWLLHFESLLNYFFFKSFQNHFKIFW
jgi:hypothetical protein